MALYSDATMVLYCDIESDSADHDDWHTYEHLHERLSIPGFLRGTRWVAESGTPRYLIVYELSGVNVANSAAYLARLNDPTPWTASIMGRLRGMIRGFCRVAESAGYGLGSTALSMRFSPDAGREDEVRGWIAEEVLPAMASWRGIAGASLLVPAGRPPMTREQSIRGRDADMPWVLMATGYDSGALSGAAEQHFGDLAARRHGVSSRIERGTYAMQCTVTAKEIARSAPKPPLSPEARGRAGQRRSTV